MVDVDQPFMGLGQPMHSHKSFTFEFYLGYFPEIIQTCSQSLLTSHLGGKNKKKQKTICACPQEDSNSSL